MRSDPIAIFDSGLGGLTVVRQVMRRLPAENIVYFGDTARVPYGIKSAETVTRFVRENIEFLQTFRPKLIIAACNTASAAALPRLNGEYDFPLCGVVEPGARAAVRRTRNGRIGVIGTEATIGSGSYARRIAALDPAIEVFSRACPLIVPLVEEGRTSSDPIVEMALAEYLRPLNEAGVDTIVLGCTHYPLLKAAIKRAAGLRVQVIDSARETAAVAEETLDAAGARADAGSAGRAQFFASDHVERFTAIGRRFLGKALGEVCLVQPIHVGNSMVLRPAAGGLHAGAAMPQPSSNR